MARLGAEYSRQWVWQVRQALGSGASVSWLNRKTVTVNRRMPLSGGRGGRNENTEVLKATVKSWGFTPVGEGRPSNRLGRLVVFFKVSGSTGDLKL